MSEPLAPTIPHAYATALREAVAAGEYASVDDALADALEAWSRRHEEREEELAWVRARIHAAMDDPRPTLSMQEVKDHMEAVFANARKRRDAAA